MTIETEEDVIGLKRIGRIVSLALKTMLDAARPGITTRELDAMGERLLAEHGARSAPKLTCDFPGTTCISINEQVARGIPGERSIQAGDLLNIDVSAELGGYFADTGGAVVVPPSNPKKRRLCYAARMALKAAMRAASAGKPINGIGAAIERAASRYSFRVIENLRSHGIGRTQHELPLPITRYFDPSDSSVLQEGMVITVKPFLSTRSRMVTEAANDGWTLVGCNGNLSAKYEHTMIITKGMPIVVTQY